MRPLAALVFFAALACGGPAGRTLHRGGAVITLDTERRVAEALGGEGDRIGALPGFVGAHGHPPRAGLSALAAVGGEAVWRAP